MQDNVLEALQTATRLQEAANRWSQEVFEVKYNPVEMAQLLGHMTVAVDRIVVLLVASVQGGDAT
jgi:hypothetical protein